MSTMLCASILSRGLTPEQRREEKERLTAAARGSNGETIGGGGGGRAGSNDATARESLTARMLAALDAAEDDLRSESVPMRARGVVTLTRCVEGGLRERTFREVADDWWLQAGCMDG